MHNMGLHGICTSKNLRGNRQLEINKDANVVNPQTLQTIALYIYDFK